MEAAFLGTITARWPARRHGVHGVCPLGECDGWKGGRPAVSESTAGLPCSGVQCPGVVLEAEAVIVPIQQMGSQEPGEEKGLPGPMEDSPEPACHPPV